MDDKQAEAEARRIIYVLAQAELKRLKAENDNELTQSRTPIIEALERIVEAELYDQAHNAHILAYYIKASQ